MVPWFRSCPSGEGLDHYRTGERFAIQQVFAVMKNLSKFRPQHRLVYDTFMKLTTDLKKDMEKKEALDFQGQQDDEDRVRYNDYDYFEEYFNYWVMSLDFSHGSPIPPQLGERFILELETNIFFKIQM